MTEALEQAISVFKDLHALGDDIEHAAHMAVASLRAGNKLLICGNGGSACEAQHLAGELAGRYKHDRRALAAVSLNADGAVLTCIGNDYHFEDVFARQLEAIGRPGDLLIVFSTSGESPNILRALETAKLLGLPSLAFLGRDGGMAAALATQALIVRHSDTARIQEAHQFLMHCLMDHIEKDLE
jgi:D-sedoheptulose 7-phosphate isomerase